ARPTGSSFLPERAACSGDAVSIETGQSGLDCSVLAELPGKSVILGLIDLGDHTAGPAGGGAEGTRRALPYVPAERVMPATDCGMKYLPRDVAFAKMQALAAGAALVRKELASG